VPGISLETTLGSSCENPRLDETALCDEEKAHLCGGGSILINAPRPGAFNWVSDAERRMSEAWLLRSATTGTFVTGKCVGAEFIVAAMEP
jgi:hypothetical protein